MTVCHRLIPWYLRRIEFISGLSTPKSETGQWLCSRTTVEFVAPKPPHMSLTGPCQHCETRLADAVCDRCGTQVCRLHYDGEMGFCADCAERAKPDNRRGDIFRL